MNLYRLEVPVEIGLSVVEWQEPGEGLVWALGSLQSQQKLFKRFAVLVVKSIFPENKLLASWKVEVHSLP